MNLFLQKEQHVGGLFPTSVERSTPLWAQRATEQFPGSGAHFPLNRCTLALNEYTVHCARVGADSSAWAQLEEVSWLGGILRGLKSQACVILDTRPMCLTFSQCRKHFKIIQHGSDLPLLDLPRTASHYGELRTRNLTPPSSFQSLVLFHRINDRLKSLWFQVQFVVRWGAIISPTYIFLKTALSKEKSYTNNAHFIERKKYRKKKGVKEDEADCFLWSRWFQQWVGRRCDSIPWWISQYTGIEVRERGQGRR